MIRGVSHVDTFDPKPFLNKNHDKPKTKATLLQGFRLDFKKYGQCGTEFSDLFPHIGGMADDICMIGPCRANSDHFGATIGLHTGSDTFKRPSIGSWVSYGLGTYNANLPSFMVISPGLPYAGGQVWGSDFLPYYIRALELFQGPNLLQYASSHDN